MVKAVPFCFVQVWIPWIAESLMEIEDPQERADAQLDFQLVCAEYGWCSGPIDPDHMGRNRGAGLKCSDLETAPMCRYHHSQRHDGNGFFDGWTDVEKERFCSEAIAWTRARLDGATKDHITLQSGERK